MVKLLRAHPCPARFGFADAHDQWMSFVARCGNRISRFECSRLLGQSFVGDDRQRRCCSSCRSRVRRRIQRGGRELLRDDGCSMRGWRTRAPGSFGIDWRDSGRELQRWGFPRTLQRSPSRPAPECLPIGGILDRLADLWRASGCGMAGGLGDSACLSQCSTSVCGRHGRSFAGSHE